MNSEAIRTERLEIVDKDGTVRGAMGSEDASGPYLALYNKEGKAQVMVCLTETGYPALVFRDEDGQPTAHLHSSPDGTSQFELTNAESTSRLVLTFDAKSRPSVALRDNNNVVRAGLFLDETEAPFLVFYDKDGNEAAINTG